jgi:broad specificity phosphatase PhoE
MLRATRTNQLVVTFVRHSESANNLLNAKMGDKKSKAFMLQKLADPPLTDRGLQQAQLVAQRLAGENADATLIVTSYFQRALHTAAAIEATMHAAVPGSRVKVLADREFHEVGGCYQTKEGPEPEKLVVEGVQGLSAAEVLKRHPTFHLAPGQDCSRGWWLGPTKEDTQAARQRALHLWRRIAQFARQPAFATPSPLAHTNGMSLNNAPTIIPIGSKSAASFVAQQQMPSATDGHESIIVVTHGLLYSLMMNEAKQAGYFVHPTPEPGFDRLTNTAITRVEVTPPSDNAVPGLRVHLDNCDAHVRHIGTLKSTAVPMH